MKIVIMMLSIIKINKGLSLWKFIFKGEVTLFLGDIKVGDNLNLNYKFNIFLCRKYRNMNKNFRYWGWLFK